MFTAMKVRLKRKAVVLRSRRSFVLKKRPGKQNSAERVGHQHVHTQEHRSLLLIIHNNNNKQQIPCTRLAKNKYPCPESSTYLLEHLREKNMPVPDALSISHTRCPCLSYVRILDVKSPHTSHTSISASRKLMRTSVRRNVVWCGRDTPVKRKRKWLVSVSKDMPARKLRSEA
jgi:hypothetical protein